MSKKLIMHAVQYDRYGGGAAGLKHVEVPVPTPKKGEVLIRSEAISLNRFDWKIQKGIARPILPRKFPHIPGTDVAGEVVEVGQGVTKFKVGDQVVANVSHSIGGGLAEYFKASEKLTVKRPPGVSPIDAAGLPVAAITALQALRQAGLNLNGDDATKTNTITTIQKKNILITAASSGVGHHAVQLAKLSGDAHITVTCGTRNVDLLKALGADEVLDYTTPEGAALKSPSGKRYDAVVHCTVGIPWKVFAPNLSDRGKVIHLTPELSGFVALALTKLTFSSKRLVLMIAVINYEDLEYLVGLVEQGKLKTMIDSKHPLSKAEEGWAKSMDGHATGKIILENDYISNT